MSFGLWIQDGVKMLGNEPRQPGAHICCCWYYDHRRCDSLPMCEAKPPWNPHTGIRTEERAYQFLHLGDFAEGDDCPQCLVKWDQAMLDLRIYHHTMHASCWQVLAKEDKRQAKIQELEAQLFRLRTERL